MEKHNEGMLREGALEGKTILVTGGGTGLGRSMGKYFLELGANLIICSRKLEVIEAAASELEAETGGKVLAVQCDVTKYDQVEQVLKKGIEKFGTVNGLVNNAAGNFISPTERLSHRAFDIVVDIVLKGSYNNALALGKYWIDQKIKGTMLSIITSYAYTGSGFVVPSACAKAGVLTMTRSLASEWGKYGIRANAVAPGPFPTKGAWDRLFPENLRGLMNPLKRIPLGRAGEHQELSNLAAYLMSDYSAYVTGDCITIDGAEWIQGAGQFNWASEIPMESWDEIAKTIRKAGKK